MLYRINPGNYKGGGTVYAWGEEKMQNEYEAMKEINKVVTVDVYFKKKWRRIYGRTHLPFA